MTTTTYDVQTAGRRGARILEAMTAHPLFERLTGSSMRYTDCWETFTGYPVVSKWDRERDVNALLVEALRVLALKAAVYEATGGDEIAAELLCPAPIDEMIHAVLAQFTVMTKLQTAIGVQFPHATEHEEFAYERGCLTDQLYAAAGFGEQASRYWLGSAEVGRRLAILDQRYQLGGLHDFGRRHDIDFETAQQATVRAAG